MPTVIPRTSTITVRVLHNEQLDHAGGHEAWERGYQVGDQMIEVLAVDVAVPDGLGSLELAELLYSALNFQPSLPLIWLTARYRAANVRSLSRGDVLVLADVVFAADRAGWTEASMPTRIAAAA